MDNLDYMELVKNEIEHAKLLNTIKPEYRKKAEALLNKKKEIIEKNGFLADFQLKIIHKKLKKLKTDT